MEICSKTKVKKTQNLKDVNDLGIIIFYPEKIKKDEIGAVIITVVFGLVILQDFLSGVYF